MALGAKQSETIHGKTGSDKAKLQANYDEGHIQTIVDLAEDGQPELGALILQIEKMQEDIDELREIAIQLARANHKQSQFIANALEIMCNQQDMIHYLQKRKTKK